jgi:hypothetical protein
MTGISGVQDRDVRRAAARLIGAVRPRAVVEAMDHDAATDYRDYLAACRDAHKVAYALALEREPP